MTFDGIPATIISASATSIEVQVPPTLAPNITSKIQVTADAGQSAPLSVPISELAPAIFPSGILNQDGSVNTTANPAILGTEIQIFYTGANVAVPGPILVKLHDRRPSPVFSGPAPGLVGMYQVNVVVPSDLPTMTTQVEVCGYGSANPNQPVCSAPADLTIQEPQQ